MPLLVAPLLFVNISKTNVTIKQDNKTGYEAFIKKVDEVGAKQAYTDLKKDFLGNETAAHNYAHIVGLEAFKQKGVSGLKICDEAFSYGCYHGFIEAYLTKNGLKKIKDIEKDCVNLGVINSPSCLHGIGHGVMNWEHYDVQKALTDCDLLEESLRGYCYDGVFMENNNSTVTLTKRVLTEANLNFPCDSVFYQYRRQCYRNQVFAWESFFKGNSQRLAQQCGLIETEFRDICFETFGVALALNFGQDINQIKENCALVAAGFYRDQCLLGSLEELMFEGKDPKSAQEICSLTSDLKTCQERYGQLLTEFQERFQKVSP